MAKTFTVRSEIPFDKASSSESSNRMGSYNQQSSVSNHFNQRGPDAFEYKPFN